MPTIETRQSVLERLAGKKITGHDMEKVKGEINTEKDAIKIELEDTNRPDLWSVEGVARVFRERGIPKLKLKKSGKKIIVDKSVQNIRPYIGGVIAKNIPMTKDLLLDLIQMQEKMAESFGRKRQKLSIGIYNFKDAKFPLNYKAVRPKDVKFAPLEFQEEMDLDEILERHPKGHQYGHIVKKHKLYPIFTDAVQQVLSFPPIINSNYLGRVTEGMNEIFVEVTGDDIRSVNLVVNIFALALQDRGAKIESVTVTYSYKTKLGKKTETPYLFNDKIEFHESLVKKRLGFDIAPKKIKELLESMQYDVVKKGGKIAVTVPYYRRDIMHPFDVIEDIGIAYGYGNIEPLPITSFTAGEFSPTSIKIDKIRRCMIGLGFQETLSFILSNKKDLHEKTLADSHLVEIDNYMSETYSAVRDSILPSLLNIMSKNMHVEYPQKIFEAGECAFIISGDIINSTKLGACVSDDQIGYEDVTSVVDALLRLLGISYELVQSKNTSFIEGRQALILVKGKPAGTVGEIHPQVLENWNIDKPVVAFELDIEHI